MGVRNGFQGFKSRLSSAVSTTVSHHHPNSWNTTQGESFFSAAAVLLCYSVMPRFFCHPAGHSVSKLLKNVSLSYVDFGRENSNVFALHDICSSLRSQYNETFRGIFYHYVCRFLWNFRPGPFVEFPGQLFRLEDE